MKKLFLSLILSMAAWMGANAMSFNRAQAEALYLTDKMAYELNLNDQQYNDAYEINLDYFLRIDSPSDVAGMYYDYRLHDLRCILHDWQYSLLYATDYFLRPILWRAGGWYFPIYSYYNRGYFYYSHPTVYVSYRGGHSRYYHNAGFYTHRRPVWNGGLRGPRMSDRGSSYSHHSRGNGYHIDLNGRRGGGSNRGDRNGNYGRSYDNSHSSGNHHNGNVGRSYGNDNSHRGTGSHGSYGNDNSHRGTGSHSNVGRGNSFDGSSSRMSGASSSSLSRSSRGASSESFSSNRRGSVSSFGSSHAASSASFGSSRGSGMSRSGGFSSSRGSGMSRSGGSNSSRGGVSRSGRR